MREITIYSSTTCLLLAKYSVVRVPLGIGMGGEMGKSGEGATLQTVRSCWLDFAVKVSGGEQARKGLGWVGIGN